MPRSQRKPQRNRTPPAVRAENDFLPVGLPLEIWHEIINWCKFIPGKPCLRNLCLASKALCAVAQPLLLTEINLGTASVPKSKRMGQIKSLAKGNCRASIHARILVIDYLGSFESDPAKVLSPLETSMLGNLERALRSFKSIERVVWYPGKGEPHWVHQTIMNSLAYIVPKELCIEWLEPRPYYVRNSPTLFDRLLEDFVPNSPHLRRLEVNASEVNLFSSYSEPKIDTPLQLESLGLMSIYLSPEDLHIMLRHLKKLKSFCFRSLRHREYYYYHHSDPRAPIWNIMKNERVHLADITTDTWTDTQLISYLDSYEGLQNLTLEMMDVGQDQLPEFSLTKLLATVSSRHSHSLVKLGLRAEYRQTKWLWQEFTDEAKTLLLELTNLKDLEVTVARESSEEDIISLLSFFENALPSLQQLVLVVPFFGNIHLNAENPHFSHRHSIVALSAQMDDPGTQCVLRAVTKYQGNRVAASAPCPRSVMVGKVMFVRRIHRESGKCVFIKVGE